MLCGAVAAEAKEAQLQQAFEGCCNYFEGKFHAVSGQFEGKLYIHRINATDPAYYAEFTRTIFACVRDVKQNLMEPGFLD